jgi:hypothetical protein
MGGKVPKNPNRIKIQVQRRITAKLFSSFPFHRKCKKHQRPTHARTVTVVFPDNEPTGRYQMNDCFTAGLSSERIVAAAKTVQANPAAKIAAAEGPFFLNSTRVNFTFIIEKGRFY